MFHIRDPWEFDIPCTVWGELVGLEKILNLLTRRAEIRKSYLRGVEGFRQHLSHVCEHTNCHYPPANTAQPLDEVLITNLTFRFKTTTR